MSQGAKVWIRSHPLEAFFVVAIGICFATLFPAVFLLPENTIGQILRLYLGRVGVYSPALAGILVAGIIRPARQRTSSARRRWIFLAVWILAVLVHTASLWSSAPPGTSPILMGVLSLPVALLPAFVVSSAFSSLDGVRQMLTTLVRPKGRTIYYLVALLTFPIIHIVGTGITNALDGDPWLPRVSQAGDLALTLLITFFSVLLFSGGINEESGWRGFAQKRLQTQYSPLVANLILWFLMVIWHIPNDLVQYRDSGYILVRIALYPFITILFGWVYNRTEGSILAPAIFHASMNSMNPLMGYFPITTAGNILLVGFALVAVVSDRMWHKLPAQHPAVAREAMASAGRT